MAGSADNRTEKPTRRRLDKAREKGQVARSKEVPSAAVLLGGLLMVMYTGQSILRVFQQEMKHSFSLRLPSEFTIDFMSGVFNGIAVRVAVILLPVLLAVLVSSIASNLLQGGLVFSSKALRFHFDKLNPTNGLKRIFSKNGLVEVAKSIVMLVAFSYISYRVVSKYLPLYPRFVLMDVDKLFHWTAAICFELFLQVAVLLIVVAIADFYFQKYRFTEQLKMTKQEVKEEFKETEGDPLIKGRIRRIQREMSRKRMMADVPTADVIITNPTHYAIALSYKMDSMEAPKVVAKGVGFLALRIRELAQEHGIPIVENRPLAQTLYKSVEIGEYIPANLYRAVAEILAYVYKAKNALIR